MRITLKNKNYNLPDFLIVGAAKSGTTSLHYNLGDRDDVCFPKVKEPHFFAFYNDQPEFKSPEKLPTVVSNIDAYVKLFKRKKENAIVGDASPSSLYYHHKAIKNIKALYGEDSKNIKIVIILRNPVDRAWSQYWHFRKNSNEDKSFLEAIDKKTIQSRLEQNWNIFYDYIGFGMYSDQIKAYQEHFNAVKVFLFEDLKNDPKTLMDDFCEFIEIEPQEIISQRQYNPSGLPKKDLYGRLWKLNTGVKVLKPLKRILPYKFRKALSNRILEKALERQVMPDEIRRQLESIYKQEIEQLYDILKREEIKTWIQ